MDGCLFCFTSYAPGAATATWMGARQNPESLRVSTSDKKQIKIKIRTSNKDKNGQRGVGGSARSVMSPFTLAAV